MALVMLGPPFLADVAVHGQLNTVAFAPLVAAGVMWSRLQPGPRRAVLAGLLVGLGAALKTIPLVGALAMLPTARNRREAGLLLTLAIGVPALSLAPFALTTPRGVLSHLRYAGIPGIGGLSLLIQPSFAKTWLQTNDFHPIVGPQAVIQHVAPLLQAGLLLALTAWLIRRRAGFASSAAILTLFLCLGADVSPLYLLWPLPFLLMEGRLLLVLSIELVAAVMGILLYTFIFGLPGNRAVQSGRPWLYLAAAVLAYGGAAAFVATSMHRQQSLAERLNGAGSSRRPVHT